MKKKVITILTIIVVLTGGYTAYGMYADQKNFKEVQTSVDQLFSDKDHEVLADGVDEALLNANQKNVGLVKNEEKRAALKMDLLKATNLFQAEELAKKQVSALWKSGVVVDQLTQAEIDEAQKLVMALTDKILKAELQTVIDQANEQLAAQGAATQAVTALFSDKSQQTLAEKVDRKACETAKSKVDSIQNEAKKKELMDLLARANTLLAEKEKKEAEAKAAAEAAAKAAAEEKVKVESEGVKTQSTASSSANQTSTSHATNSAQPETGFAKIVANSKTAQRTNQIVTVVASGTSATVTLWEKANGVWKEVLTTKGYVGSQGVGAASEGSKRTPNGAYMLGFAFGKTNPGTRLPFRQITPTSYWISDVNSNLYNTWQEGNFAGNGNEHLADYENLQYYYAIVINYNTSAVKGAGSAFFLHVSNGRPTAGCVSVPKSVMETFMKRIHSGAYIINVTSQAEVGNY